MVVVAKSRCTCGRVLLWKGDEARSDEWLLVASGDVPDKTVDLGGFVYSLRLLPRLWTALDRLGQ
jgi:hypothetical protein